MLLRDLLRRERLHPRCHALDVLKLGTITAITRPRRQSSQLSRHRLIAIAGIRMIAEKLRAARPALAFELFEKVGHRMRIVARVVHDVSADQVGFALITAGVL